MTGTSGLGTKWVGIGEGETVKCLSKKVEEVYGEVNESEREDAAKALRRLGAGRTNLALTANPITDCDLRRIQVADVSTKEEEKQ
jgi:hypothetical protein